MKTKLLFFIIAVVISGWIAHRCLSTSRNINFLDWLQPNSRLAWPSSGQAAIGSLENGVLASSSSIEKQRPTASMAKVITALAIMKKQPFKPGQQGQTYIISDNDMITLNAYLSEGGSVLPLLRGMKITQYEAMQRMLIASDNNIADMLVDRVFGSRARYVLYAEDMLKHMGLSRTQVADASGFDAATISTPSELVAIGIAALRNPVIAKIVAQKHAQMPVAGRITNTNQLLGTNGIIGIKTGTTFKAGSCLLFAAVFTDKDGRNGTIVGVIMGDYSHRSLYKNTRNLITSARKLYGRTEGQSGYNGAIHTQHEQSNLIAGQ